MHRDHYVKRGVPEHLINGVQVKVAGWRRSHANATLSEVEAYANEVADEAIRSAGGGSHPNRPTPATSGESS